MNGASEIGVRSSGRPPGVPGAGGSTLGYSTGAAELVARVRCRLAAQPSVDRGEQTLSVGGLTLDLQARRLRVDDRVVNLSQREFLLLQHLMRRSPQVCSREELLSEVWGYSFDPATNVVDVCVGRLRQKLRNNWIQTVRNVGYELQSS